MHSFIRSSLFKTAAIAALLACMGSAQAALTVYTTQVSFASAISASGVDTYAGLSTTAATPGPLTRSAGAYGYTATASSGPFYGAGTAADPWLSPNFNTDSITFGGFTAAVGAIGGNFFTSGVDGAFVAGDLVVVATDSFGVTSTRVIANSAVDSFLGFVSTGNISSLVVTSVTLLDRPWPTVDNLTLAVAAPIPEPATYGLLLAGLVGIGLVVGRRRSGH